MPRLTLVPALVFALVAISTTARAQTDDPQQLAIARALFEEGLTAFDAGQLDVAEDRFRRSIAIRRSSAVAFNLANLLAENGLAIEPRELLLEAAGDEAAPAELRDRARRRARELEARIARLTVRVEGAPSGSVVRLDERELQPETFGVPIPVDPGERHLVLAQGDSSLVERTVQLEPGGRETVELAVPSPANGAGEPLEGGSQATGEPDPVTPSEPGGENVAEAWWLWTIVGVLAAGLIVGGVAIGIVVDEGRYYTGNVEPGRIVIDLE